MSRARGSGGYWRCVDHTMSRSATGSARPTKCHRTVEANIRFHRLRRTAGVESSFPYGPERCSGKAINPSNGTRSESAMTGRIERPVDVVVLCLHHVRMPSYT
jgi:hypothetical protein